MENTIIRPVKEKIERKKKLYFFFCSWTSHHPNVEEKGEMCVMHTKYTLDDRKIKKASRHSSYGRVREKNDERFQASRSFLRGLFISSPKMVAISPCIKAHGTFEPAKGHFSPLGQYTCKRSHKTCRNK